MQTTRVFDNELFSRSGIVCWLLYGDCWRHSVQGVGNRGAWTYSYSPYVELGARVDVDESLYLPGGLVSCVASFLFCAPQEGGIFNFLYWLLRGGPRPPVLL